MGGNTSNAHLVIDSEPIGSKWIIKPRDRPRGGLKETVTEYLAGSIACSIGLPVPQHVPVYLPLGLIREKDALSGFTEGYCLGIRYEEGIDLSEAMRLRKTHILNSGLSGKDNTANAVAIVVGDTWLCNPDRATGLHGAFLRNQGQPSANESNLYFAKVDDKANVYVIRAIDFNMAFYESNWGAGASNWPQQLFGLMRVFVEYQLISPDYTAHQQEFQFWFEKILALDLPSLVDQIIREMPSDWLAGSNPTILMFSQDDWADLLERLEKHRQVLRRLVENQFCKVVERYR